MEQLNAIASAVAALAGAATAVLMLARAKNAGSTGVVHHIGAHRSGLGNRKLGQALADLVGVLTLNPTVRRYKSAHDLHHSSEKLATIAADPDGQLVHDWGFQAGRPLVELKRLVWRNLWTGRALLPLAAERLRQNFLPGHGPAWRLALAWLFWPALVATAAAGGWLAGLLLGAVLPLLLAGSAAGYFELLSRHGWGLPTTSTGRQRHAELSHGRYPMPAMPPHGAGMAAWLRWWRDLAGAAVARAVVLPWDNPHHDAHHTGAPPALRLDRVAWTNADVELTPRLYADPALAAKAYASIFEAIDAWLLALSNAPVDGSGPATP